MASKTRAQSSADRHIGPTLSMLQLRGMAPCRLTLPNVGRSPVAPQTVDGETMEPQGAVPSENPTSPAEVAAADPAEEPLEPCSGSHGLRVCPPNQ